MREHGCWGEAEPSPPSGCVGGWVAGGHRKPGRPGLSDSQWGCGSGLLSAPGARVGTGQVPGLPPACGPAGRTAPAPDNSPQVRGLCPYRAALAWEPSRNELSERWTVHQVSEELTERRE